MFDRLFKETAKLLFKVIVLIDIPTCEAGELQLLHILGVVSLLKF